MRKRNPKPKLRRLKIYDIPVDSASKAGRSLLWGLVMLAATFLLIGLVIELVLWPITGRFDGSLFKVLLEYVGYAFVYGVFGGMAVSIAMALFCNGVEVIVEESDLEDVEGDDE
jgi:hypothetical protein